MTLSEPEREPFFVDLIQDCSQWPIIVIVDHPLNPHVTLPTYHDAFCISLPDWYEINRHLRSIHEVLRYVGRVLEHGADVAVPLSHEYDRFSSLVAFEGTPRMSPRARPWTTFAAVEDAAAVSEYRTLLERTWGPNDELPGFPIDDYREMLDFLDDAPAVAQAFIGRWLVANRSQLRSARHRVSGSVLVVDRPLVLLMDFKDNKPDKRAWLAELWALTVVRAIEYRRQTQIRRNTLGIAIRVFDNYTDEYSYILMRPDIEISENLIRETEWRFGVANFSTSRVERLKVRRNERCPCHSGKKFKYCHGVSSAREF
ncbi:SEC-C domain-containing protein [Actinoplanes sp. NPDC020271]|uniref:SEC-C domain-containing protein n=1 Tax=Actinoplanes sp. NPDC020271 TaxID=3363896 RepID=UPI0037903C90